MASLQLPQGVRESGSAHLWLQRYRRSLTYPLCACAYVPVLCACACASARARAPQGMAWRLDCRVRKAGRARKRSYARPLISAACVDLTGCVEANKAHVEAHDKPNAHQSSRMIGSVTDKMHFFESNFALPFFGSHGYGSGSGKMLRRRARHTRGQPAGAAASEVWEGGGGWRTAAWTAR